MNDDPLSAQEQARLASARVPVTPPAGQDDRIVAALRQRGLLRPRLAARRAGRWRRQRSIVVAVAWAFVPRSDPGARPAGPRYVLMLYGAPDPVQGGDRQCATRSEYAEWARGVARKGVAITGEELAEESRALGAARRLRPEPMPRGFFVVWVPDLDAAQQIASTCPHLRYGGRIVIQRIL